MIMTSTQVCLKVNFALGDMASQFEWAWQVPSSGNCFHNLDSTVKPFYHGNSLVELKNGHTPFKENKKEENLVNVV